MADRLSSPPPDLMEKYRKLKRKYFELEEKHKETSLELQRSGERNVKMREERTILLNRIIALESQKPNADDDHRIDPSLIPQPGEHSEQSNSSEQPSPTRSEPTPITHTQRAQNQLTHQPKQHRSIETTTSSRSAKPKRLKAHTVTTKSHSIPPIPRLPPPHTHLPMLPLNVGIMTVISLGEVCMREHFHTERYIFPVGYEVTRRYLSTIDPTAEVVYHCTILDGGDGPKFQIVPSDTPSKPIIAGTATGAWSRIVKEANAIRNRVHSNSVSGPDFFGLGQNTIKCLIQELEGADRLRDYVWQNFIEGGPLGGRHAAVIPALPEEVESIQPLGAFIASERERERERERGAVRERERREAIASGVGINKAKLALAKEKEMVSNARNREVEQLGNGRGEDHAREGRGGKRNRSPPSAEGSPTARYRCGDHYARKVQRREGPDPTNQQQGRNPYGSEDQQHPGQRHYYPAQGHYKQGRQQEHIQNQQSVPAPFAGIMHAYPPER